jgi:hypothetical protein
MTGSLLANACLVAKLWGTARKTRRQATEETMLNCHETEQVAAQLVERYGTITPAAAILRARDAEQRGELILMTEWQRIAREALRLLPTDALAS